MTQAFAVDRKPKVLLIQHAEHEHPAIFLRALETQAIPSHWIHPYRGDGYPELASIGGIISLGGPMSANDDEKHPWISEECTLLAHSARSKVPTVGICLGGQMLARGLGATVRRNTGAELGWWKIQVTNEGRRCPLFRSVAPEALVYHWHYDTFELPKEAVLLASSEGCARQAFRWGELAYGFQFHPEADHQLVNEWLDCPDVQAEIAREASVVGARNVQAAHHQRMTALRGELDNLKISLSLTQLFESRTYSGIDPLFHDQLEDWAVNKIPVRIGYLSSSGEKREISGKIQHIFTLPPGVFLVLREDVTTLPWPFRLDLIRSVETG